MSRSIASMDKYPFNPQFFLKIQVESHDKKLKDQRAFMIGPFFSKSMGVFQSFIECFLIG